MNLYAVRNKQTKEWMQTPKSEVVFASEQRANRALAFRWPTTQDEWEVVEVEITAKAKSKKAAKA